MADTVELVPKGALDRLEKTNTKVGRTAGARLARVAEAARPAESEPTETAELPPTRTGKVEPADTPSRQDACGPSAGETRDETRALPGETPRVPDAAECVDMFQIGDGCVVVVWRVAKVDDWTAPILGAACKEILTKKRIRKVVFDLSGVDEMSTAAVSTLVRFKNTIVHLDKSMSLVAGPRLRVQLAASYVDRMIEVVDSVARVVGSGIRFEERRIVRGPKRWWWLWLGLLALQCPAFGPDFLSLPELERQFEESPELTALRLEVGKLALAQSWTRNVNLHASYSQHFASYVPVLSEKDRQVSGDTFVLGISVSTSLDDLLHKRKNRDLELKMIAVGLSHGREATPAVGAFERVL
jgi:anti-anti-sigma regulatory factor